jgi:hypothetical protein
MKKCKVTLALNAKPRSFCLAPDAETLYLLSTKTIKSNDKNVKLSLQLHPDIEIVTLRYGEYIEAEWNGCQNFHDEGIETIRTSFVRLVRSSKSASETGPDSISVHFGWILSDHLRFTNHRRSGMRVKMLNEHDEQFNFNELFPDNLTIEDMIKEDRNLDLC